jgi:hypothetical protein
MFRAPCAHRQEVKTVLYSLWYHHNETSEWFKITKIFKYEHIVAKFAPIYILQIYIYIYLYILVILVILVILDHSLVSV